MNLALPRFLAARPVPFWALLGALAVLTLAVADVVLRFVDERPGAAAPLPPVLRPSAARSFDIQQIIRSHPFGQADAPAAKAVAAPDTRLRLRLVGVVASTDPDQARAMIATDGGKARSFAVGRPIAGTDATLHAIEERRVLIRRGGAVEQLKLERKPREGSAAGAAAAPLPRLAPMQPSPELAPLAADVPATGGGGEAQDPPPAQESGDGGEEAAPEDAAQPAETPVPPRAARARK